MPDFIPVLVAAILGLMVMLLVFGGGFGFYGGTSRISESSKTITLGEDFTVSYSVGEMEVATLGGEVRNGLFSYSEQRTEFEVENFGDASEGTIVLNSKDSNYYGNLMILVNGIDVYKGAPNIGEKTISFDSSILQSSNVLEVKAESSGWKIWAPTVYVVDMDVSVSYESKKTYTSNFELTESEVNNLRRARLVVFGSREGLGKLEARLNGVEIYYGRTPVYIDFAIDSLKAGTNTVDLSAEPDTSYSISSAQVVLFFG